MEVSCQLLTAFNLDDIAITNEVSGVEDLLTELVVQICSVGDENNRGAGEQLALHQDTAEEEHGETLSAAGSAEVCPAFSVSVRIEAAVLEDGVI